MAKQREVVSIGLAAPYREVRALLEQARDGTAPEAAQQNGSSRQLGRRI